MLNKLYKFVQNKLFIPIGFACLWLIMVLLVQPIGDFPLNDDWCFGKVVYLLIEKGTLDFQVSAPTLFTQALWGAVFCMPFGFSFTALRMSTLTLGLIGILATFFTLKEVSNNKLICIVGTLLIAVNPLYFVLANSFMTDVPFYAFMMLSVLFFIRAIKYERNPDILIATILACIAILTRQIGLVISISFAVSLILKNGFNKKNLLKALSPVLVTFIGFILYSKYMDTLVGLPAIRNEKLGRLFTSITNLNFEIIGYIISKTIYASLYLGLFLLPLLLVIVTTRWINSARQQKVFSVVLFASISCLISVFLILKGRIMPVAGNILYDFGLGPPLLHDTYVLNLPHLPSAPKAIWLMVTFAAVVGASLIVEHIINVLIQTFPIRGTNKKSTDNKAIVAFTLFFCLFYFGPLAITGFFDRYLILLIPILVISIICSKRHNGYTFSRPMFFWAYSILIVFALFAIGGTHDYLAWNKARWKALNHLVEEKGISPHRIDGGYEFKGWYRDPEKTKKPIRQWWFYDDEYIISFGPLTGYEETESYTYDRWLPPGKGKVQILHRMTSE